MNILRDGSLSNCHSLNAWFIRTSDATESFDLGKVLPPVCMLLLSKHVKFLEHVHPSSLHVGKNNLLLLVSHTRAGPTTTKSEPALTSDFCTAALTDETNDL